MSGSTKKSKTKNCVEVSAGLIFHNGKLLITQRHSGAHLGGLWEFPGGKREAGETFKQCLVRELREELGVDVMVGELLETIKHTYQEKTVRLKFFICRLASGEPEPLGCAAVKWVSRDQLAAHEFPAADTKLLDDLRSQEGLWR